MDRGGSKSILASARSRTFAVPLLAMALISCKSMTSSREMQVVKEMIDRMEQEAAGAKAKKLQEEKFAIQAERRAAREDKKIEATHRLASGNPEGALGILERLFNPPPEIRQNAAGGQEERLVVDPEPLEPAEEAQLLFLKGLALYQLNLTQEAITTFRSAIDRDGRHRLAARNLGKLLFSEKRYEEALDAWKLELAEGYRDGELLYLVAQARYELGTARGDFADLEAARSAMQSVLVERPHDAEVRRWLAILEYETGRYEEAIHALEAIRRDHPLDADTLETLADCHRNLGRRRQALDLLQLASRLKVPDREGARNLGELYAAEGHASQAAVWLGRSWGNDPRAAPPEERLRVGQLHAEAGRAEDAVVWLISLGEGEKPFAEAQSALVGLHETLEKPDRALAAYENSRRTRPQDGPAHLVAGRIQLSRKQYKPAADAFARAAGLPESRSDGLAGLAEVSYASGRLETALSFYAKALQLRPGEARFQAALRQIEDEIRFRAEADSAKSAPRATGGS